MRKLIRWFFRIVLGMLLIIVLFLSVIIIFKIPIDLTRFKDPVEEMLSKGLKRPVRIEESVVISTSLNPYFTIKGFKIENPDGFETDNFLSMELAKIQVELPPLLKKKVHISEIQVQGLQVTLEETGDGKVNWAINTGDEPGKEPSVSSEPAEKSAKQPLEFTGDTIVVRKLDLQDINVDFHRPDETEPAIFKFKRIL